MTFRQPGWSKTRAELLMDITAGLGSLTQRPEDVAQVPEYLSRRLEIEPLSIVLVREHSECPEMVLGASSGVLAGQLDFLRDLTATFQRTARPELRPAGESAPCATLSTLDCPHPDFPRATLFSQRVDVGFRMLLVVHQRPGALPLGLGLIEGLQAIAQQLAKFLAGIAIWLFRPEGMGAPFDRLTNREWMVLRGLSTAAGEKQLADQLKLSPHTLHSHIKSIYRKTGVQGRLPLLLHAQEALRELHCQALNRQGEPAHANANISANAAKNGSAVLS